MATQKRRSRGGESVRKLTRTGRYTYYVTIPKEEVEKLGWKERQKVRVRRSGQKIIIEDWKPKR